MASTPKKDSNVSVGVRVRPLNEKEINAEMPVYFMNSPDGTTVHELDENSVVVKHWSYDNVFGPTCTNLEVFQTMGMKLVDAALDGYNTVMFMYGQTSSGKTFTLFGDQNILGVVQHAMEYLYQRVMSTTDTEYLIKLTYAELYNEEIKDLLSPTPNENLRIIDDPNVGPMIQNITEAHFTSAANVKTLLQEGENRRHFGVTNMNAHSSRSHVIVRLHIESRKVSTKPANPLRQSWGKDKPNCVSTLNLVDLAGSERANKAGTSGQSLKEGSFINRSLLTLGTVISNLSEGKTQHIPYRNSKLTRLLATALGGNAKTCVITCISPASGNVAESLNTLRFATRAKRIINIVHKNEIMDVKALSNKLSLQMAEIEHLRHQLDISRQLGFTDDGDVGESLRDKAVIASKTLRSLRFLVRDGPRLMNGLRSTGATELSKKVLRDLKVALVGGQDLGAMIEAYSSVINDYLPNDRKLLSRIHTLAMHNEAEMIINVGDGHDLKEEDGYSDDECDEVMNLFEFGGEEVREELASKEFESEDIRSTAIKHINKLQSDINDGVAREKSIRKTLDDVQAAFVEQTENIRLLKNLETTLHKQIDDLKLQRKQDQQHHNDQMKTLNNKVGELQVILDEKQTAMAQKNHELMSKEGDNERLRNQSEQLSKDLQSAIASKKAFEEEVSRARSEMRIQMDRLRNNMHEMLLQGGNEAKVIESQNMELQKELDQTKDELERANSVKENLELELQQVRASITDTRNREKALRDEINVVKNENMDLQQKLRESRIEITQLTAALSFAEESTLQLQNQIKAEIKTREDLQAANETEMDTIKERFRLKANDMQVELDIKDAEIESLEHQLQSKAGFIAKLEQSFASDTTRLEKKLAAQQKLCDILTQQNTNAALAAQSNAQKYHEEIRKLKSKLQDQEKAVLSITEYVDQQEKKLYDEKHSVFYGNNNLNHNSSFYGSGSFYGGGSISRIGSMAIDVDDNMSTTSSFYGTSPVRVESKLTPDLRSESLDAGVDEYGLKYVEDVDEDDDEDKTASSQNKVKSNTAINMNIPRIVTVGRGNSAQTPPSALKSPKSRGVLSVSIDLNQNVVNSGQKICDSPLLSPPRRGEFDFDSLHLDSSYYEQLLYGLQLATTHMEMNLLEEKSIRNYLIKTDHHHKEFENELHYQVQKLSESEDFLLHGQRQLQESVQFHQSNYTNLQERYSNLEDKFNEHVKELYRVNKLEKVGNIQMQNIEQTLAENKLMVDKLKHEVHALKQDNNDLKLNQMQLEGKLEEGNQEYLLLQSFCDLIQKEKELLQQEKQDMVLKYMSSQQQSRQSHNNMAYDHQDDYDDSSSYLRHEDLSAHVLSLTKPAEAITRSRSSSPKTTSKLINSASAPSNPEMTVQDLLHKYRHLAKPHLTSVAEERKSATTSPLRQKSYSEDFSHDNSAVFEPLRLSDQVVSNITSSPSPYNNTLRTYALNTGLPQYEPARSKRSYRK